MSLFYQITKDTANFTKSSWFLNQKSVNFNIKAERTFNVTLPRYNVPLSFSKHMVLKGGLFSSDYIDVMAYSNDLADINYNANLVNSDNVAKAEPSFAYNNNKRITSNIKKNKDN